MAAHSACDFGGGKAEKLALAKYRQVIWQGRVLNSQFTDEELRSQGRCPLTPEETGLLLAALGFDSSTRLYLASHKVIFACSSRNCICTILFARSCLSCDLGFCPTCDSLLIENGPRSPMPCEEKHLNSIFLQIHTKERHSVMFHSFLRNGNGEKSQ